MVTFRGSREIRRLPDKIGCNSLYDIREIVSEGNAERPKFILHSINHQRMHSVKEEQVLTSACVISLAQFKINGPAVV